MAYDRLYRYYDRLNDPKYQQQEIGRRTELAAPELRDILAKIRSDLNRRGLFSTSPMTRATTQAGTEFASNIATGYYEDLDARQMNLLEIISRIEASERERKSREKTSLWEGIGGLAGTALSFIPGLGGAGGINKLIELLMQGGGGGEGFEWMGGDTSV
jgi:hypothetical protein